MPMYSPWGTVLKGTTVKSSYDTFARRGDPWDASERQTRDGELRPSGRRPPGVAPRLSQEARLALLKAERSARVAEQLKTLRHDMREHQKLEASLSVDLDHILKAGRAIPHGERLKKERNLALDVTQDTARAEHKRGLLLAEIAKIPQKKKEETSLTIPGTLASIAATRARLRKMRQIVKVR